MNPSYVRIKTNKEILIQRFPQWIDLEEKMPLRKIKTSESIDASVDEFGNWTGIAILLYQKDEWTVIHDLTGYLSTISAEQWRTLAEEAELIFLGYNDAVPYGQMTMIENGKIVREFLEDLQEPGSNINQGKSKYEEHQFNSWMEIASFIDDDEMGYEPDEAELWIFKSQSGE
jgi:hypothetical protein